MNIIEKSIVDPDIKAVFEFNGVRQRNIFDGIRPIHALIVDGKRYLTTGIHRYFDKKEVLPNETVQGTITFISPEAYPHCLDIGDKIDIYDGPERVIGTATVTGIMNPLLKKTERTI